MYFRCRKAPQKMTSYRKASRCVFLCPAGKVYMYIHTHFALYPRIRLFLAPNEANGVCFCKRNYVSSILFLASARRIYRRLHVHNRMGAHGSRSCISRSLSRPGLSDLHPRYNHLLPICLYWSSGQDAYLLLAGCGFSLCEYS